MAQDTARKGIESGTAGISGGCDHDLDTEGNGEEYRLSNKMENIRIMITREEAFNLLKKYNKDSFHIQHALTVEAVMKWYARELGYAEEEEYWGIVGLLHDIDFELYPSEHCLKAPKMLREAGVSVSEKQV